MSNKPFDPTKPVQTRDGQPARIICTDRKGAYPIVALISYTYGEDCCGYGRDGRFADGNQCHRDLINIPEKIEGWVNVYSALSNLNVPALGRWLHPTKAAADAECGAGRIACIPISVSEGEGLS